MLNQNSTSRSIREAAESTTAAGSILFVTFTSLSYYIVVEHSSANPKVSSLISGPGSYRGHGL